MPHTELRPATPADAPAIADLVNSAYRGDSGREGWTTESDLIGGQRTDAADVAALLAKPSTVVLVAESEGSEVLACCELEHQGDAAYFGMFSVRPVLQGSGIGAAVLAAAERYAAETWGAQRMEMKVISVREELIAWYERRGYHRTGEFTPFPYGQARFGEPLVAGLRFETLTKDL
ncbi:GNAT family N-acetyltransferase [Longispora albida]|uniref:GNAT family N-acetyltransferase n=1 Tax=Longispora albida TaxID=203523 RepID=UPI0003790E3F|nr:GNAT family N-acetyltransferase [Longispora albida]